MVELRETLVFSRWLRKLGDREASATINLRLDRLRRGHLGDVRGVGEGVSELRIHYGPGYRVYFIWADQLVILLLCGGDKSDQSRDIARAKVLAREWRGG